MRQLLVIIIITTTLLSCGSTKTLNSQGDDAATTSSASHKSELNYLRHISDNALYSQNIAANIVVDITAQDNNFSVDGKLQMARDKVIRITLVPYGLMEVGRLEFTPDYVLLVNRMKKVYVKATYSDLDFLKDNGLDFYCLQALFWNELFVNNKQQLSDSDLSLFTADMQQNGERNVTRKTDNLWSCWLTETTSATIKRTDITYRKGTEDESTASFVYDNFTTVDNKQFPSRETLSFNSSSHDTGKLELDLKLSDINTIGGFETQTTLSKKYTQIDAENALTKILSM